MAAKKKKPSTEYSDLPDIPAAVASIIIIALILGGVLCEALLITLLLK